MSSWHNQTRPSQAFYLRHTHLPAVHLQGLFHRHFHGPPWRLTRFLSTGRSTSGYGMQITIHDRPSSFFLLSQMPLIIFAKYFRCAMATAGQRADRNTCSCGRLSAPRNGLRLGTRIQCLDLPNKDLLNHGDKGTNLSFFVLKPQIIPVGWPNKEAGLLNQGDKAPNLS
ncbi:hypothetical protein BKA93DRAFT_387650 [Sparassis latifolia]